MESALAAGMFRYLRQQEPPPRLLSPPGYLLCDSSGSEHGADGWKWNELCEHVLEIEPLAESDPVNNDLYVGTDIEVEVVSSELSTPDIVVEAVCSELSTPDIVVEAVCSELIPEQKPPPVDNPVSHDEVPAPEQKPPPAQPKVPAPEPHRRGHKMSAEFYNRLLASDPKSLDPKKMQNHVSRDEENPLEEFGLLYHEVTPLQNTALHLVARQGFDKKIRAILAHAPSNLLLLRKENSNGELALHLAAGAGHLAAVDAIMEFVQRSDDREFMCATRNKYGETSLHVAVRNKHISVARSLVKYHPKASFFLDATGDSPLSLAAQSGGLDLVKHMIKENQICQVTQEDVQTALQGGQSVVHAAILGGNSGVLEEILKEYKIMIKSKAVITKEGVISPLALAGFIGNVKMVKYILKEFPDDCRAYRKERSGFYPIHIAAGEGHKLVIEELLRFGPDLRELLTSNGQNILHVSASRGRYDVVSYILNQPDFDELINARDDEGNTPLHLAADKGYPKVVDALTWDNRVRLDLMNKHGMSAMDLALTFEESGYSFNKQLTWLALKYAGASKQAAAADNTRTANNERAVADTDTATATYKDRVNALSVVAALVITVTFTAGFVIPGVNNGSRPDLAMTSPLKRIIFRVFVISNSIALYMSILDLLVLIFAMLGDVKLAEVYLKSTVILLTTSLVAMSISFISALYLVVSSIWWLGILVWVMGSVFIVVLLLLFFLLSPPMMILPTNQFTRYLAYPAFKAMLYISEL